MNMKNDRIEDKKGEVMDTMGKTVSKLEGNNPARWIRLILVLASVFSLIGYVCAPESADAANLLHNSTNLGSTKWASVGGWGIQNGKYGEFTCDTCHVRMSTNIKSVRTTITTPDNSKGTLPGDGQWISFDRMSGTAGDPNTMGDDSNTPRTSSNKICEICHTYSTGQNGVSVHAYDTQSVTLPNHMQANAQDCTGCHLHNVGFKAVACDTCHGMPPTVNTTGGPTGLALYKSKTTGSLAAGKHEKHATTIGYACEKCHNNYVMPFESTTKPGYWDISISFNAFGSTAGTYSGQTNVSYNNTLGDGNMTCSSVYCHSGTGSGLGGANMTPTWTGSVTCGDCHKATASNPPTLGNHARHAGSGAGQLNLACTECHGTNGNGATSHLDGQIQWSLNTSDARIGSGAQYNGAASGAINNLAPSSSYQGCSSVYCHSNAQGLNGSGNPTSFKTPTWGGGSLNCGSCHANMSGGSGTGSHNTHANTYGYSCDICHNGAGSNTTKHADHSIDISYSSTAIINTTPSYSQDGTPGNGYGTCNTVYCHSNVQAPGGNAAANSYGTPTWGDASSLNCGFCHTDMSTTTDLTLGTHQRHTNAAADGVQYACSMCHGAGYTPTTVNTSIHANGIINTTFTGQAAGTTYSQAAGNTPGVGGYGTCSTSACHGRATKFWGFSSNLTLCEKCHGSTASIAVDNGFRDTSGNVGSSYAGTHQSHLLGSHNYRDPLVCEDCHIKPTNVTDAGHMNGLPGTITWGTLANGAIGTGNPTFSPAYSGAPGRTCSNTYCHTHGGAKQTPYWGDLGYGLSCGNCHGNPPAYPHPTGAQATNCHGCHFNVATDNVSFVSEYRLIDGICSNRKFDNEADCNSNLYAWTSAGTKVPGRKIHIDGRVQASKDECLGCHSTYGDYALIGQHYLHTDNDFFLSRQWTTSAGWGTATGGSIEAITVPAQSWLTDSLAGMYVRITSGPNSNKQLKVLANDTTSLTFWRTIPVTRWATIGGVWTTYGELVGDGTKWGTTVTNGTSYTIRTPKQLSNDDYDDPSWIYNIEYINGFPRYACGFCHPSDSSNHRNGTVNLDMDPTHSLPGTVKTKNDPVAQFNAVQSGSEVYCTAVYCHSNGYLSPDTNTYAYKTTPNWYATTPWAGLDRCSQCHGNSPNTGGISGSAAHSKHSVGIHYDDTFNGTNGKMSAAWVTGSGHGDGNSTVLTCNTCHYDTVKVTYNDKNSVCTSCHSSSQKGTMAVDPDNTKHVNGSVDVVFNTPLNFKTKAQLRDNIVNVPTLDSSWTRSNGYKKLTPTVSHDQSKVTPVYSAGTCSNTSCHNQTPMQWNQAGPLQCMVCHLGLTK